MESIFIFKPLEKRHLDTLCGWLNKKHVKEWLNDNLSDEELKLKYQNRIGNLDIVSFIAYQQDMPIGFIQFYYVDKIDNSWWSDEMKGTVGIDQFIGEESLLNHGYGMQMIEQFLIKLFSDPSIKKVIIAVDPKNHRAIRCYEKAGFCFSNEVNKPGGRACLFSRYRNTYIEPHAYILKKPTEKSLLYKIVSLDNFFKMVRDNYLYFTRVDTYSDDKRDSDQPDRDKKLSEKSKFENSPEYTARHYYDSCRSKTYASCFSTENTPHIWEHYGDNDPNSICIVFHCHKLINFLNARLDESRLIYLDRKLINFFFINYGLVIYGDFNDSFLKKYLPTPIEYVYFKDKKKYAEEKEFRISLSCLGICGYKLQDGTEFNFPNSLTLEFNFAKAIQMGVTEEIIISHRCTDKTKIITQLNNQLGYNGITIRLK